MIPTWIKYSNYSKLKIIPLDKEEKSNLLKESATQIKSDYDLTDYSNKEIEMILIETFQLKKINLEDTQMNAGACEQICLAAYIACRLAGFDQLGCDATYYACLAAC